MAKNPKKEKARQARRAARNRRWQVENEGIEKFRRQGPYLKTFLRMRGCELPFYDWIDSYATEFKQIAETAVATYPTLLGVREVEPEIFDSPEEHWQTLGCEGLTQQFFNHSGDLPDYGQKVSTANLAGATIAFHDEAKHIRSIVLIKKTIKTELVHEEYKYVLKVASLCHEIGHVHDIQNGLNFHFDDATTDIIEAEVFAHLFALDMMAKRNLYESYKMLREGLKDSIAGEGYLAQVSQQVISRLPDHQFVDWQAILNVPPTENEMRRLGPAALRAFSDA